MFKEAAKIQEQVFELMNKGIEEFKDTGVSIPRQ
jgi:hypothetical protein